MVAVVRDVSCYTVFVIYGVCDVCYTIAVTYCGYTVAEVATTYCYNRFSYHVMRVIIKTIAASYGLCAWL